MTYNISNNYNDEIIGTAATLEQAEGFAENYAIMNDLVVFDVSFEAGQFVAFFTDFEPEE